MASLLDTVEDLSLLTVNRFENDDFIFTLVVDVLVEWASHPMSIGMVVTEVLHQFCTILDKREN